MLHGILGPVPFKQMRCAPRGGSQSYEYVGSGVWCVATRGLCPEAGGGGTAAVLVTV